MTSTYLG